MDKISAQNFTRQLAQIQWQAGFLSARKVVARTLLRYWTVAIFLVMAPFVVIPWLWLGTNVAKTISAPDTTVTSAPTANHVVVAAIAPVSTAIALKPVVSAATNAPQVIAAATVVTSPQLKLAQDLKFSEGVLFYTGRTSLGPQGRAHAKRLAQGLPAKSEVELRGFAGKQKKETEFSREFIALGRAVAVRDVIRGEGFKGKMTIIDPKYYLEKRLFSADPRQVEVTVILARAQR